MHHFWITTLETRPPSPLPSVWIKHDPDHLPHNPSPPPPHCLPHTKSSFTKSYGSIVIRHQGRHSIMDMAVHNCLGGLLSTTRDSLPSAIFGPYIGAKRQPQNPCNFRCAVLRTVAIANKLGTRGKRAPSKTRWQATSCHVVAPKMKRRNQCYPSTWKLSNHHFCSMSL